MSRLGSPPMTARCARHGRAGWRAARNIVVDSKVSLAAYLGGARPRTDQYAKRDSGRMPVTCASTWTGWRLRRTGPRSARHRSFVVLFIPGEAFLAPALEHDPELLEHAMARKVHIATPTTLVTHAADRPVRLAAGGAV